MLRDLSVQDALAMVLAHAPAPEAERIPVHQALGRVLAASVSAPRSVPPFDTSAMDGYAVRAQDCTTPPLALTVAGSSVAGAGSEATVEPGTAIAIATGAPLPSGADAIVPIEWTTREHDTVRIRRAPEAGRYIRRAGSGFASGAQVLPSGQVLTPPTLGVLGGLGLDMVEVAHKPRVYLIVTGDEVVAPGEPLAAGQIHDANGPGLTAQIQFAGAEALPITYASDEQGALREHVLATADVIVLSGGVSVGPRDRVRDELEASGAEWAFWRVRQRPGKPLLFGTLGGVPVFGLPGNPVSASVCFEVYVRPLLAAMQGLPPEPIRIPARLGESMKTTDGLQSWIRVVAARGADGCLEVTAPRSQDSHVVASMLGHGLALLPSEWDHAPAGAEVSFMPFAWLSPHQLCSSAPSA